MLNPTLPCLPESSSQIKRALSGDRQAQSSLIAQLGYIVRAAVRHQLAQSQAPNEQSIEDVSQNTWLGLFAPPRPTLAQWQPDGMSLRSFVGRAARWQARMYLRGQRAGKRDLRKEVQISHDLADPRQLEQQVVARQLVVSLAEHLEQALPERGRLIFRLLYEDGLDIPEVAERLRVNKQVVYNWKYRIRECAREFTEDQN